MIIHCTQKLATKLPEVSAAVLSETSLLGGWHANLYTIDHHQCVIFCHDETRYALFLPGLRVQQFRELDRLHRELFLATLKVLGVTETTLKRVTFALGPTRFNRATDKSVLSSMTVVRSDFEARLMEVENVMELDPVAVSCGLTHRPTAIKGKWLWPDKAMLELVNRL